MVGSTPEKEKFRTIATIYLIRQDRRLATKKIVVVAFKNTREGKSKQRKTWKLARGENRGLRKKGRGGRLNAIT